MEFVKPCTITNFGFKQSFPNDKKEFVVRKVIDRCKYDNLLGGITMNHSAELGFELPLTYEWRKVDLNNKTYLDYHSARQLRFVEQDGIVTGMRLKDGINYMSDIELNKIKELVEKTIFELNY